MALAAVRHISTFQRMPVQLRIPPQRSPRVLTTFVPPKRCGDDAHIEPSARMRHVQNNTQYISLQRSSHDLSYEYYERQFSRKELGGDKNHSQRCSQGPSLEYTQQGKDYGKRLVVFMRESDKKSNDKCYCRGCEQH